MEYEINQEIVLIHKNKTIKLKVEEDENLNCENCFFNKSNKGNNNSHIHCIRDIYNLEDAYCSTLFRNDRKSIIYRKIK